MKQLSTVLFFLSILWACQKDSTVTPTNYKDGTDNINLLLGNPTNATDGPSNPDNYLVFKTQFISSHNNSLGIPNWSAWHLEKRDLGAAERKDDFRPDDSLPTGFRKIKPTDYTSSDGFDRGHMCPSADRTLSQVDNSATFLMTNITPQAPELNRGIWEEFEAFCREQVYDGNEIYIYAGQYGVGGDGSQGYFRTIASGSITVPSRFYKVVLIIPDGLNDLSRITANSTVIAVDMPNTQSTKGKGWEDYITTASKIESNANADFWSKIPSTVSTVLKNKLYSYKSPVTPPTSTTTTTPTSGTTTPPTSTTTTPPTSTTTTPSTSCGYHNGKKLYKGPEGGCYYINSNGNKTYVSRSECTC